MVDDVLINKAATIERCVARARDEYFRNPGDFATDFTRQDAAILNIQRACEAALDVGQHLIRREKLGVPQSARDVFTLLAGAGWIAMPLAEQLRRSRCTRPYRLASTGAVGAAAWTPWPLTKALGVVARAKWLAQIAVQTALSRD